MIIIGVCAVVVLALVAAAVVVGTRAFATVARTPEQAVIRFLDAVADKRSADAIALLSSPPADRTLLTDDFLSRSIPPEDIKAEVSSAKLEAWPGTTVEASYQLGNVSASGRFSVSDTEEGWRVNNGVTPVRVGNPSATLPVLAINGTPVSTAEPVLFPGRYGVELVDQYLGLTEDGPIEIGPQADPDKPETVAYEVTEAGQELAEKEVTAAIEECLAERAYEPGCGIGIKPKLVSGATIERASIDWSLTTSGRRKLQQMTFVTTPDSVTLVRYPGRIPVMVEATCVDGSAEFTCRGKQTLGIPEVDLLADPVTIGWR
jgi:hypothetical protein